MSRHKNDPLRALTETEFQTLQQISRSQTASAVQVTRAKILVRVAQGSYYREAARAVGRSDVAAVSKLVSRFNQEGLQALTPRHAGGPTLQYDEAAEERIRTEFARTPSLEQDGTATWTLSTLQKTLRNAPDGLPRVSTFTLWRVLKEDGPSHQNNRTWCDTGTVLRKRKDGIVSVTDPDTDAKKN
jgi:transposase